MMTTEELTERTAIQAADALADGPSYTDEPDEPERPFPLGLTVSLDIPGEFVGWDADRGTPEWEDERRVIVGRVERVHELPHGDAQVFVRVAEQYGEWGFRSHIRAVLPPVQTIATN